MNAELRKTLKLLRKAGFGLGSTAGLFSLGILACTAYALKNGSIENPFKKKEEKGQK